MQTPTSSSRLRHLNLAVPFAVVGFAAGWLSDGLLANPLVDVIPRNNQLLAATVASACGALLGGVLSRWGLRSAQQQELGAMPLTAPLLASLVIACGVITGALVGGLEMSSSWGALSGALHGGLSAIAFLPICALVLAAARRADRARQGSIVAGADRRAVWSLLAAALAVTTLAAALDVPPARGHLGAGAWMAFAAGAILVVTFLADALALSRIARVARADFEEPGPGEVRTAGEVPSLDLGLGDDVRATVARAGSAYRSRARATALLLGSIAEARAALRQARFRGAVGLAVTAAVLVGHRWAETPAALVAYDEQLCDHRPAGCYEAGLLLLHRPAPGEPCAAPAALSPADRASLPVDVPRAEGLLLRGCMEGNLCSCDALGQNLRERHGEGQVALPYWYTRR